MVTKQEILARAKEIIISQPSAGKERINRQLRTEFGVGLRSATVLKIKSDVASEMPRLLPELYGRGSVPKGLNDIYKGWIRAGFMAFEARELTLGHGERYRAFNAKAVFDSAPAEAARQTRINLVRDLLKQGWTKKQIRENIFDYYKRSKERSPWDMIRAEYKPSKKVDYKDYRAKARKRAKAKQRSLQRGGREDWISELRDKINKTTSLQQREQYRQQIINLGGKP